MKRQTLFLSIITTLLLVQCVEEFDFSSETSDELLFIDGMISQGPGPHTLQFSRSAPFGSLNFEPVDNASITLFDDKGSSANYVFRDNIYQIDSGIIEGVPGDSYFIRVELGDQVFESVPERMPAIVQADTFIWNINLETIRNNADEPVERYIIDVSINTPVNQEETSFLRWATNEVYLFVTASTNPIVPPQTCYITVETNPGNIILFDGSSFSGNEVNNISLISREPSPSREFAFRHFFNAFQFTHTPEAFEYWQQIRLISNQSGGLFDVTPARIEGNICNTSNDGQKMLGYFFATSIDTVRTSITRTDLEEIFDFLGPCEGITQDRICSSCFNEENSSPVRPDFFDD